MKNIIGSANESDEKANLSRKALSGGSWVIALRVGTQVLNLARMIILGRLLAPADFGLMGIALMIIIIFEAISQTGFQHALVQSKENVYEYLNTVWSLMIIRGVLLLIVLIGCTSWTASYFNTDRIGSILPVMSIAVFLNSISNPSVLLFIKKLDFKKQVYYESSGIAVEFVVAVVCAVFTKNVWALVLGYLAGAASRLITSFLLDKYRPRFSIQLQKAKNLLGFGRWITGSSILILISGYLDNFIVAKLLGASNLGYYRMAYQISNLPATEVTYTIGRVILPTYAKIQDDSILLKETFLRVLRMISLVTFPISVMIIILGRDFVMLFLGEKWLPMVETMQILGIAGLLKSLASTGSPFFTGVGYSKYEFIMQSFRCIIILVLIYPLTIHFGITGAAIAVTFSSLSMFLSWLFLSVRISKAHLYEYIRQLMSPLIGSLVLAGFFSFSSSCILKTGSASFISFSLFIGALFAGLGLYFAIIWAMSRVWPTYVNFYDVQLLYNFLKGKKVEP